MFGCMRRVVALMVVVVLVGIAWMFRDSIRERFAGWFGKPQTELTEEELVASAEAKLETLAAGEAESPVGLSELEARALARTRMRATLPGFVHDPGLEIRDGGIRLDARVPVDQVPRIRDLGAAATLLPDTAEVGASGTIVPMGSGQAAFAVDQITVAGIPVPKRLIPRLVGQIRGGSTGGASADAIPLRLPPGVESVHVRGDSLILTPVRGAGDKTGS